MRLVNMDVDRLDSDQRFHLGPFSPGLNAVCGPNGSGKTTLLRLLRQLTGFDQRIEHASYSRWSDAGIPVSGAVELNISGRPIRAYSDRSGRVHFDSPSNGYAADARYFNGASHLTALQQEIFSGLATADATSAPETALTRLATRVGLAAPEQAIDSSYQRTRLAARQSELRSQLERIAPVSETREMLDRRRVEIEALLNRHDYGAADAIGQDQDSVRLGNRKAAIESDLRNIAAEIAAIDHDLGQRRAELRLDETNQCTVEIGQSFRRQLQELDDRLDRWRQTLRDLKSHREQIEHTATNARLDQQIGQQLSLAKEADPRAALRSLEASILNTRKQLDEIVGRMGTVATSRSPSGYQVVRDHLGQTKIAYTAAYENSVDSAILPEMLVSMQKDLQEVCQQLARHESDTACETLRAQSQQLRRCETELLQSVEKLIEERASLLRKIADEHHLSVNQLTLAFGQWCQCHDHMNLHDWLLREEAQASKEVSQAGSLGRQRYELLDEIESLTARRKQADLRGDECRRQLRNLSVPLVGHPYSHAATNGGNQLLTELSDIDAQLNRLTQRERIQAELAEVTRQLTLDGRSDSALNSFDAAVNQHIAAIMGGFSRTQADRAYRSSRPTLPIDERRLGAPALEYETYEKTVPKEIVCVAIRIAITEAMRARHEPIPLFVDGSLDHMPAEYQQRTLEYLAQLALQGQQVVVLTSDDLVAQQVYHLRGWVGYLNVETQRPTRDVNRQLAAYANEHEADKWYQPAPAEKPFRETRGEYYLNDLSLIEESPSVSAVDASRCRALGIDRIGDLLDADPTWLAENLKIDGVSTSIVSGWQAEARLLCSVRHLRPFDARIIVGAGVRTPQQLAEMQPAQLLERVERFLQTASGRSLMNTASDYELSRISNWIASARNGAQRYQRSSLDGQYDSASNQYRDGREVHSRNRTRAEYSPRESNRNGSSNRGRRQYDSRAGQRSEFESQSDRRKQSGYPVVGVDGNQSQYFAQRENRSRASEPRQVHGASVNQDNSPAGSSRYYLEVSSPVVDAPSIGPKMAQRLEALGIYTVGDLLAAEPRNLANLMNLRRVDAEVVRAWQMQSQLVCRIPNLRGHDAQMLVACNISSPENLASRQATDVLEQVLSFARSGEGTRVLRGSKEPDLAEVTDWINWAKVSRKLNAA